VERAQPAGNSGIVVGAVEAAEGVETSRHEARDIAFFAYIRAMKERLAAFFDDLSSGGFSARNIDVAYDHPGSLSREGESRRAADPRSGSRHECDFSIDHSRHRLHLRPGGLSISMSQQTNCPGFGGFYIRLSSAAKILLALFGWLAYTASAMTPETSFSIPRKFFSVHTISRETALAWLKRCAAEECLGG
jgi:hypothetical protein